MWLVPAAERSTDAREVGALDEAFHATLVSAAGNAEIAKVHQDVTERIRIVRRLDFTRADRIEATYQEHAKILRAVIQRKLDVAQMLLKSHIEQSKVEVRKISLHAMHEARERAASARSQLNRLATCIDAPHRALRRAFTASLSTRSTSSESSQPTQPSVML